MKKMVFGIFISLVGAVYALVLLTIATLRPIIYNGIGGILGNLLGNDVLVPFVIAIGLMIAGMIICGLEAFRK